MENTIGFTGSILLLAASNLSAATLYVSLESTNPQPPYATWATAATSIQQAVDASKAGDTLLVTDGVYGVGQRDVGLGPTRTAVTNAIALVSVHGPQSTVIDGGGAVRCVCLADGASLTGFTLTNGVADEGGGICCASGNAVLTNCVIVSNSAWAGGGAYRGTLYNCELTANSAADFGGGISGGTLNNCTLTGNSTDYDGGGADFSTLNNCTLTGNSADIWGGGAYDSTLNNCSLARNSAGAGGGVSFSTLNNCFLARNCAVAGGGAHVGTLNNCTLTGNSAAGSGGGACGQWDRWSSYYCALNNCVVYFNSAPVDANYDSLSTLNYCCTRPLPTNGVGNVSLDPKLASASHLSAVSPCRGAGSAAYASGGDIDGEDWATPPSMGCDEYRAGFVTEPLNVDIAAAYTNLATGCEIALTALIEGRPTTSVWDFGDGVTLTNEPCTSHAWTSPGEYVVVLQAFNESQPQGSSTTLTVRVEQVVHYVDASNPNPVSPYSSWASAADNIQDAVDAATVPGALVLVADGTYASGGRAAFGSLTNRVGIDKPLVVRSVNGPQFTVIRGRQVPGATNGDGAVRCVYLTNRATLSGFTLTNGATRTDGDPSLEQSGGGVWCEWSAVVSNCLIVGNSAWQSGGGVSGGTLNNCTLRDNSAAIGGGASVEYFFSYFEGYVVQGYCTLNNCTLTGNSAWRGGGAYGGTLNNCTLTVNSAQPDEYGYGGNGGGAYWCMLNNCTLTGNVAYDDGGGVLSSTLSNCIVYFNTARAAGNYDDSSTLNYCCTTPLPTGGVANLSLDPQLASPSHLSAASPCRGAGSAAGATGTDIDGEIWANPPSIGCDEYHAGAVTGPLSVGIAANYTNLAAGWPLGFTALIDGRTTASVWEFGDGDVVLNQPYVTHTWSAPGDYLVALWAFNESQEGGVSAIVSIHVLGQPVYYVAAGNSNPLPPYTSWATAAGSIQDAVDLAALGGTILVTNGAYGTRGRVVRGTMTNRLGVHKALVVRSVNGPQFTIIDGGGAIRCAFLTNAVSLSGFTLTNGVADTGGGVWCESSAVVSNCLIVGNSAGQSGGGVFGGTLNNSTLCANSAAIGGGASGCALNDCTLAGNSANYYGGGASSSTLTNCTLTGNSANYGGGASSSTLTNCTLTGNSALRLNGLEGNGGGANGGILDHCTLSANSAYVGGGTYQAILSNCSVTGNSANYGGGAFDATLNNCALTSNSADEGGGADFSTLNNCFLARNSAWTGGGAYGGALNNCTLAGNVAYDKGGGVLSSALSNCIAYFNTARAAANYDDSSTLDYCCTTPLPTGGVANLSLDPQLASLSHLSAASPCRGAGCAAGATGTDIDGEIWANPPSIGCDEYHARAVTGPLSAGIAASFTNVAVGYPLGLTALIKGRTTASVWDFGDGVVVSSQPYTSHAWTAPGDYAVTLQAYNESQPDGVSATLSVRVDQGVHYVAAGNPYPLSPYSSWASAARSIQDAVDVAGAGALVLVTNGVYATGGRAVHATLTNRVAVDKPMVLRSVNGPQFTVIQGQQVPGATNGDGAVRCVYLTNGAFLSGFTLTGGATRIDWGSYSQEENGGGVWCEPLAVVSNCVVVGNAAAYEGGGAFGGTLHKCVLSGNSAYHGGGAFSGMLNNCVLRGNSAGGSGGGACAGTVNNCTLTGNSAGYCGGAYEATLNNCIIYFNTAPNGANCDSYSTLNYCCTTPLSSRGVRSITNAPLFLDYASGNLRLQLYSPCINAGNNAYVTAATDMDGNPRIVNGTVDIGAYESQGAGSAIPYAWLQQYGLPTDGSADYTDPDHDGMNNWQEWVCGTDPTNPLSVLRLLSPFVTSTNVTVTWQSVAGVNYSLQRSAILATPFILLASNIVGQAGTTSYADTNALGPFFYRVGVNAP